MICPTCNKTIENFDGTYVGDFCKCHFTFSDKVRQDNMVEYCVQSITKIHKRLNELESKLLGTMELAKKDAKRMDGLEESVKSIEEYLRSKFNVRMDKPKDSKREEVFPTAVKGDCNTCHYADDDCHSKGKNGYGCFEPKREATHEIVGKKTMQLLDYLDEPKVEAEQNSRITNKNEIEKKCIHESSPISKEAWDCLKPEVERFIKSNPKREPWKPKEYCRCVYESDCHGIEMIKSPSGKEWAIGGTNTKDRWIFCPWCGGEIIR